MLNKSYITATSLLLLLSLSSTNIYAQKIEISVDETLALFYQRNLELIAAQYNIDQSKADEVIASAIPNPTLSIQILEIARNANQGSLAQGCNPSPTASCVVAQYYSFSQLIEVAGKRGLRMQSSSFASEAAEGDFRDAIRIFSNMVRDAYYQLLQMQKNQWLAQEIVDHYKEIIEANRLRLKMGDISESEFLRVKMEAIRAETDLDNAHTAVEQAQAGLAVILRWPDNSLQFEAKEQWPDTVDIGQTLSREELMNKAIQLRPDLQADKLRANQADKLLDLARRLKYPDVTVNAGYARDPSNNNLNSFFVGVNVPIPLFYQYQGEADKAAVMLNQSRVAVEQTELAVRNDVVSALSTWINTDKIVERFKAGLLIDAKAVIDSSELAYSKGATSVLDFIEAQRNYKNIMRDYYEALINRTNAYYDLAKSLGIEPNADNVSGNNKVSEVVK